METNGYAETRKMLLEKRQEIGARVEKIRKDYANPLNRDSEEQAVELENAAVLRELFREGAAELDLIDQALMRIDQGEYGICTGCGEPIAAKRLAVMPFAVRCVRCADR